MSRLNVLPKTFSNVFNSTIDLLFTVGCDLFAEALIFEIF